MVKRPTSTSNITYDSTLEYSYGHAWWLCGSEGICMRKLNTFKKPSQTISTPDGKIYSYAFWSDYDGSNKTLPNKVNAPYVNKGNSNCKIQSAHNEAFNVLMFDGHVETKMDSNYSEITWQT